MANTVIMVTSECKPFVKVGGLADVPYNVAIILPRSGCKKPPECISSSTSKVRVPYKSSDVEFEIVEAFTKDKIWYYLVGGGEWQDHDTYPQDPEQDRTGENKAVREKAQEFCLGAHTIIRSMLSNVCVPGVPRVQTRNACGEKVIIHAHDWMSAFVLPLVKIDPAIVPTPPCMYTIHNYFYTQFHATYKVHERKGGQISVPHAISDYKFDWLVDNYLKHSEGFVDPGHSIKFDRTGVYFADVVTSVSEDYKNSLKSQEELDYWTRGGFKKFYGVLNGIDTKKHSPRSIIRLKEDIDNISKLENELNVSIDELASSKIPKIVLENKRKAKVLLFELLKKWKAVSYMPSRWSDAKTKVAGNIAKFNLDWSPDDPLFLMMGRIQWQKGADLFLRSLPGVVEREPNIRFMIAGGGIPVFKGANPIRNIMNSNRALYKKHIVFINEYIPPSVRDLMYMAADGFVVPSRYEPCGLTPLEAMATGGTPSVVTPIGGLKEIVKDNITGIHIENFRQVGPIHFEPDPASVGDAICELLELERGNYLEVVANCFKRIKDPALSWSSVADKYLECYNVGIRSYAKFLRERIAKGKGPRKEERLSWQKIYGVRI